MRCAAAGRTVSQQARASVAKRCDDKRAPKKPPHPIPKVTVAFQLLIQFYFLSIHCARLIYLRMP